MLELDLFTPPAIRVLTLALLHFLWQGTAVLLVVLLAQRLIEPCRAATRYLMFLTAMAALAVLPPATCVFLTRSSAHWDMADGSSPAIQPPFRDVTPFDPSAAGVPHNSTGELAILRGRLTKTGEDTNSARLSGWQHKFQPVILACWSLGVLLLGLRLLIGWVGAHWLLYGTSPPPEGLVERVGQLADQLGVRQSVRVLVSVRVREAMVVGLIRQAILLPSSWLSNLPPDVLESILLHELAHIRRHDLWVNVLQRCVETLLFYHPAVWWVSRQLRLEREKCCDELAVSILGDRLVYARSLEQVAREHIEARPTVFAVSFGGKKMELLARTRAVLANESSRTDASFPVLVMLLSLLVSSVYVVPRVIANEPGETAPANVEVGEEVDSSRALDPDGQHRPSKRDSDGSTLKQLRAENERLRQLVRELRAAPVAGEIEETLDQKVSVSFDNVPLKKVLEQLTDNFQIPLAIHAVGLRREGISLEDPVSVEAHGIMLRSALNLILEPKNLRYAVESGEVHIAPSEPLILRNYAVADFLSKPGDKNVRDEDKPFLNRVETDSLKQLADLITSTVAPESWNELGGSGVVRPHEVTLSLIIRQTAPVHQQIESLLEQLRKLWSLPERKTLGIEATPAAAEERRIDAALDRTISMNLDGVPLTEVVRRIRTSMDVNIVLDTLGLDEAGISIDQPVTVNADGESLRDLLIQTLTPLGLGYQIKDEVLKITSRFRAGGELVVINYAVADLVSDNDSVRDGFESSLESLSHLLMQAVDPESWDEFGGPGTIRPFGATGSLVVRQQRAQHELVQDFIQAIRDESHSKPELVEGRRISHICIVGDDARRERLKSQWAMILRKIQLQPGSQFSIDQLKDDLDTIHRTRLFRGVETRVFNTPNGVVLVFEVKDRPHSEIGSG